MEKYNNNFEKILNSDRLLYHYIRGSSLYGTNVEGSDIDTSIVFLTEPKALFGLHKGYCDYVSDKRADNSGYELKKWVHGLLTSNATMLEGLFVPEDKVLFKSSVLNPFFENKEKFLTKACYSPFFAYTRAQIHKMRGLNKKIVNPITEKKSVLDFCFVPFKQGSTNVLNWLEYRGMKQKYCGLNNIPNMVMAHNIYYDWGRFFKEEKIGDYHIFNAWCDINNKTSTTILTNQFKQGEITKEEYDKQYKQAQLSQLYDFIVSEYSLRYGDEDDFINWYGEQYTKERNYKGIISHNSQDVKLSSIMKGDKPLIVMCFNINAYSSHCKDYTEYKRWENERNPLRYESNLEKTYDSKNLYHCFRLMLMCKEILEGKGMLVDRRAVGDANFLLDIRNHKYEYDEILSLLEEKEKELDNALKNSTLEDHIDYDFVNDLLVDVQKKYILEKKFI